MKMKKFNLQEVLEELKRYAKKVEDSSKNLEEIAKKLSALSLNYPRGEFE
jgi:DNA repair exonuclease SbcCD ATPase subunit